MIPHQFDSNGNFADIRLPVPHAEAGVVRLEFLVENAIRPSVSRNHIMGMPAGGGPAVAQTLSFRNNPQGRFKSKFRGMDDNIFGSFTFDLLKSGV